MTTPAQIQMETSGFMVTVGAEPPTGVRGTGRWARLHQVVEGLPLNTWCRIVMADLADSRRAATALCGHHRRVRPTPPWTIKTKSRTEEGVGALYVMRVAEKSKIEVKPQPPEEPAGEE